LTGLSRTARGEGGKKKELSSAALNPTSLKTEVRSVKNDSRGEKNLFLLLKNHLPVIDFTVIGKTTLTSCSKEDQVKNYLLVVTRHHMRLPPTTQGFKKGPAHETNSLGIEKSQRDKTNALSSGAQGKDQ